MNWMVVLACKNGQDSVYRGVLDEKARTILVMHTSHPRASKLPLPTLHGYWNQSAQNNCNTLFQRLLNFTFMAKFTPLYTGWRIRLKSPCEVKVFSQDRIQMAASRK